jgi:adenylate cyclase
MPRGPSSPSPPGLRPRGRLLIVDDDPQTCALLVDLLAREGYALDQAGNGIQALERLVADPADLVLLDLNLPDMTGYEVLTRMKQDAHLRTIPVIIVSGWSEMDSILKGMQLGADDHLAKPFSALFLRNRIDACLERKRLQDELHHRIAQADSARSRAESLIGQALPAGIAARVLQGESLMAESHPAAAVLVARLTGLDALADGRKPERVMRAAGRILKALDRQATRHRLTRIHTAGALYVAAALGEDAGRNALHSAKAVIGMAGAVEKFNLRSKVPITFQAGLHCGPVVAGVSPGRALGYNLWGEAVRLAESLEQASVPGQILVSEAFRDGVGGQFKTRRRGFVRLRGRQRLPVWRLLPSVG